MISVDQFIAIMGALAVLIGAVTALLVQLRAYHQLVNSRMDQLLELTRTTSLAQGKREGPDPKPSA